MMLMCELWMQINNSLFGTVIGSDMNRHISINKIGNRLSTTLANYRRADIFLPSEILNLFVRISRCKYTETVLFVLSHFFLHKHVKTVLAGQTFHELIHFVCFQSEKLKYFPNMIIHNSDCLRPLTTQNIIQRYHCVT